MHYRLVINQILLLNEIKHKNSNYNLYTVAANVLLSLLIL